MAHGKHWPTISGEMVQRSPSKSKHELSERVKTEEVRKKGAELLQKIREAKGFQNLKPPKKPTPYWTLLTSTSWRLIEPKLEQAKTICAVALNETEPEVLQARQRLLALKHTMALRFDIWLTVNLWLRWNPTALPGATKNFLYWDQCPDQTVVSQGVYLEETAEKVSKLMVKDMELLNELGNYVTSHPSLTNNRDAAPSRRVISLEAKSKIDALLEVSENSDGIFKPFE
jgi:hypothetical protein